MSTELQKLDIEEISGVDAPANGIGGWMVMKNGDVQSAAEAQLAAVYATLGGADVLAAAPEEIQKAAQLVADFAEKQLSAPEPEPTLIEKMKQLFTKGKQPVPAQPDDDEDDVQPKEPAKPKMKKDKKPHVAEPNGTDDVQATQEAQDVAKSEKDPILKELRKIRKAEEDRTAQYADDMDAVRKAVIAVSERLETLENELTGSAQPYGQEYGSVEKAAGVSGLQAGILSAFAGNRVTLS